MIDLSAIATDHGYKLTLDESAKIDPARSSRPWYWRIPCRYGFISVHGQDMLAAWSKSPKMIPRLISVPGVKVHQRGKGEVRVVFPVDRLADVAELLQARKRRRATEAARERIATLGERYRFPRRTVAVPAAP